MSGPAGGTQAGGAGLRRFVTAPAPAAPQDLPAAPAGPEWAAAAAMQAGPAAAAMQAGPAAAAMQAGPAAAAPGGSRTADAAEEACEMCAAGIQADHGHVADLEHSTLMCACRACYLLFTQVHAGRGRFRAVPDRYRDDVTRPLSVADWEALEIPVGLAFFLRSSQGDRAGEVTGFYPSPAGATECRLDLQAWQRIELAHPMLAAATPDVEAILIYRGTADVECFLVPIDACYELAGRMRLHWRGFDGGSQARASIAGFLDDVRSRSRPFGQEP